MKPESNVWQDTDKKLRELAIRQGALNAEIGRWLLVASRQEVHKYYGFANVGQYAGHLFGYRAHATRERIRVALAL